MSARVAVVGAGIAGLACARRLRERGASVTLFDKGRAVGGRLATRREGAQSFDLGAPCFTVRDARFADEVALWLRAGVCARWRGRFVTLGDGEATTSHERGFAPLVGTPGMSAIARHLGRELAARTSHRVERVVREGDALTLLGTVAREPVTLPPAPAEGTPPEELGRFDWLVVTTPPAQATVIVEPLSATLSAAMRRVALTPCFALGLTASGGDAERMAALPFDGARIRRADSPLAWVGRDSSKPERHRGERWVLHASPAWSRQAIHKPESEITRALVGAFVALAGRDALAFDVAAFRRWVFARADAPLAVGSLVDEKARVSVGGDWAADGRVEGAFLSGLHLADGVIAALAGGAPWPSEREVARTPRVG